MALELIYGVTKSENSLSPRPSSTPWIAEWFANQLASVGVRAAFCTEELVFGALLREVRRHDHITVRVVKDARSAVAEAAQRATAECRPAMVTVPSVASLLDDGLGLATYFWAGAPLLIVVPSARCDAQSRDRANFQHARARLQASTKAVVALGDAGERLTLLAHAVGLAASGRPGPVVVLGDVDGRDVPRPPRTPPPRHIAGTSQATRRSRLEHVARAGSLRALVS